MLDPDYAGFTRILALPGATAKTALDALSVLTDAVVGAKLFTVTTHDPRTHVAGRVYSSKPDAYPVSGTKPANETDWSRQVIDEKRTFVANDIEGIAAVFDDHELIQSLGCESVINVPIIVGGEVIGTLNCLHEAGYYTPERVQAAEALKLPGAVCLLLNDIETRGAQ